VSAVAGLNGTALVKELQRPHGSETWKRLAGEAGLTWEQACELTFLAFCAALADARRKKVA
jgi:hypothetical protein